MTPEPMTQEERNVAAWEDPASWRLGLFYYSNADTRPWVPKRSMMGRRRFGGTPNFAQPTARAYLMVVLGFGLAAILLVTALERSGVLR